MTCMDSATDSKVRFWICFFANTKFILCFLKISFCHCFFYPANLKVVSSLNENKPQLVASFQSVVKSLLNFFGGFLSVSPWQFSSIQKGHVISLNYDPPILEYFWKNANLQIIHIRSKDD